jgi:hypothetical protein
VSNEDSANFVREYVDLCRKYKAEVVVNVHGVHMVHFDDGKQVSFSSVFPEWNKEVPTNCRKRKPRELDPDVPFSSEEFEKRVDKICGCEGRWDCDCVGCFGQARMELWTEYNERNRK